MGYTGQRPSAVPLTTADLIDGSITNADIADLDAAKLTGTVNNARISLDAAEIPNLDTAKLTTGTVATARLGTGTASSTTVLYGDGTYKAEPVTDTTSIKNDISILALQTAINGNLSAYGLKNSFIEQFEDSTKIENLSTALRDTNSEFMLAGAAGVQTLIAYNTGTAIGDMTGGAGIAAGFDNNTAQSWSNSAANAGAQGVAVTESYLGKDWGAGVVRTITGFKHFSTTNDGTNSSGSNTSGSSVTLYGHSSNDIATATNLGGLTGLNFREMSTTYSKLTGLTTSTAYRYHWLKFEVGSNGSMFSSEVQFYDVPNAVSAAGSFNSTDVTPSDGAAKTSVGLVLLYKDAGSSSCVLNTDVVAKVRANTGQAYQTLVLAGIDGTTTPAVTYSNSQKIAIAPAITVTSGTALSYEITWANQSAGTKEAQIYGVAMTY